MTLRWEFGLQLGKSSPEIMTISQGQDFEYVGPVDCPIEVDVAEIHKISHLVL